MQMRKGYALMGLGLLFMFIGSPSFAEDESLTGPQWCTGTLDGAYVRTNGRVYLRGSWRDAWTQVCRLPTTSNPSDSWNDVPNDICQQWYSLIQAAVVSQSRVTVYYPDAPSCEVLPTRSSASGPQYIMLRD